MTAQALNIQALSKRFAQVAALQDVALSAQAGQVVAICGPSGAGKSTLGRLISGLEYPDAGGITIGGRLVHELPPQRRRVAHMFESFALYPTLSVFDNVASPLRSPAHAGRIDPASIPGRVREVLDLTQIGHLADRRPAALSGGQKQRVALCRTLVQTPDLFVLDEPIGHLDAKLRHTLRGEIRRRQAALGQATLWLTPDAVEAMAIADHIVMLVGGRVRQAGTPREIYLQPADVDVARLVGDPAMNLIPVAPGAAGSAMALRGHDAPCVCPPALASRLQASPADTHVLGIAPIHCRLAAPEHAMAGSDDLVLRGQIYATEPFGKYTLVTIDVGAAQVRVKETPGFQAALGEAVSVCLPAPHILLFDGATGLNLAR